jgi:hypothetical protein
MTTDPKLLLLRIAQAHVKRIDPHGGDSDGMCAECEWRWPCSTYLWATGVFDPDIDPWYEESLDPLDE